MAFITTSITTRGILSAWNTWRKISTRRPSAISTRMRRTIISCAISPTCRTSRSSSPGSRASKYSMRLTSDSVLDGLPAGTSGVMDHYRRIVRRRLLLILLLALLIVASLLLDFMLGPSGLPLQSLWQTLTDPASADPGTRAIVWDIRLPYAVMAIIVGLALGLAGAEMQTILNNPLASPFTLGVSSAAAFGAALAIVLGIGLPGIPGQWFISANAFIFALLAALLLDGITRWTQVATSGVILFGIALVFTFNALVSMLQFIANEDTLQGLVFWTMGSIDRASWSKVAILLVALALVMPLSLRSAWKLTALRLGEDRAISFGINVRRLRLTTLLRISILSALSVAFVGPIGFIGLVAPHIARMLFGEDHRFYLPASALIGALVLSLASIASKNLIPGAIIPVGIVTSLVGVPFFLSIILRHRGQV
ncbi:putative ABC transporter permease [Klebsiella pneumoniae subsp. pneumoniae DSM 30104 = JCM 1662 = NBRC 14940]|nr:putative ABC transporter permease [Klebsiella pneumoniae subsp. pneumoniae DSM 30104 = JCM 1662 = NBRC 14940]